MSREGIHRRLEIQCPRWVDRRAYSPGPLVPVHHRQSAQPNFLPVFYALDVVVFEMEHFLESELFDPYDLRSFQLQKVFPSLFVISELENNFRFREIFSKRGKEFAYRLDLVHEPPALRGL